MRKFYFEDNFEEDDKDEEQQIHEDQITMAQMDLFEIEMNKKILIMAIKICEKSFFWPFYSCIRKLNLIKTSYTKLINILSEEEDAVI
jgi:hypothetical protein